MSTQRKQRHQRNFVAKHASQFNKATVEVNKKKRQKHNKPKYREIYGDV